MNGAKGRQIVVSGGHRHRERGDGGGIGCRSVCRANEDGRAELGRRRVCGTVWAAVGINGGKREVNK